MKIAVFAIITLLTFLSWSFAIPAMLTDNKPVMKRFLPLALGLTTFLVGWAIYFD